MQISEEVKEVKTNIDTARDFLSSQGTLSLLQVLLHDGFIGLMQLMDCEFWKMQNDSYSKGRFYSFNQRIGSDASFYNKTISQWLPFAKEYRGVYQIDIVKLIDSLISYSLSEDGIFEVIERLSLIHI